MKEDVLKKNLETEVLLQLVLPLKILSNDKYSIVLSREVVVRVNISHSKVKRLLNIEDCNSNRIIRL